MLSASAAARFAGDVQEALVLRHAVEHRQKLLRRYQPLLIPNHLDAKDRVLDTKFVEPHRRFERNQTTFGIRDLLKPVGQRLARPYLRCN